MDLYEYQAKQLFVRYGLPAPAGYACITPREAEETMSKAGAGPQVVRCQVYAGGRGKAGGMKVVGGKEDIRAFVEHWLGKHLVTRQTDVHDQPVNQTLVEAVTSISKELYLGVVADRSSYHVVSMAPIEGGVEIEKVTGETPHLVHKVTLDPLVGPTSCQGRELAFKLGPEGKQVQQSTRIFIGLTTIFLGHDLVPIEINPLVVTKQDDLICSDGRLGADGNALFRQADLRETRDQSQEDPCKVQVVRWELNYVALDGNIGYMVNGTGLAMGTMDIVKPHGGEPANLLDVGGSATKEHVTEAFKIILSDGNVEAVLVNIFGGIVCCDPIADGITGAIAEVGVNVPVMVCLGGNNAELGVKKLADNSLNIIAARSLADVAQQAVAAVEGK